MIFLKLTRGFFLTPIEAIGTNVLSTTLTVTTRKMQGHDSHGLNNALLQDSGRTLNRCNTVHNDTVDGTGNGAYLLSDPF